MHGRMLAIGAAAIALAAVGCSDAEVEVTAPPNSGRIGEPSTPLMRGSRPDAAQIEGATRIKPRVQARVHDASQP